MKKNIASLGVVVSFSLYALFDRFSVSTALPIVADTTSVSRATTTEPIVRQVIADLLPSKKASITKNSATKNVVPISSPVTPVVSQNTPILQSTGKFKDGSYTGPVSDAYYGNVQVRAVVSGGRLVDVIFLLYPSDRSTSVQINSQAMPMLVSEAIHAQSAKVNTISGATATSEAFVQSLGSALASASV